jgi:hypothetical protein
MNTILRGKPWQQQGAFVVYGDTIIVDCNPQRLDSPSQVKEVITVAKACAAAPDLILALCDLVDFRNQGKQPPTRCWQAAIAALEKAKGGAA